MTRQEEVSAIATLYQRVRTALESMIADEGMAPGDRIPGDRELAETLGVSIITVRRALQDLQQAGIVTRQQGKGTFVRRVDLLAAGGLQDSLHGVGLGVATHAVQVRLRAASTVERESLRLRTPKVWEVTRLRGVTNVPLVIDHSVLPAELLGGITESDFVAAANGLYRMLTNRIGLQPGFEEKNVEARLPVPAEQDALHIDRHSPVLVVWGTAYTDKNEPFDYYRQVFTSHNVRLSISGPPQPWQLVSSAPADEGDPHGI